MLETVLNLVKTLLNFVLAIVEITHDIDDLLDCVTEGYRCD